MYQLTRNSIMTFLFKVLTLLINLTKLSTFASLGICLPIVFTTVIITAFAKLDIDNLKKLEAITTEYLAKVINDFWEKLNQQLGTNFPSSYTENNEIIEEFTHEDDAVNTNEYNSPSTKFENTKQIKTNFDKDNKYE